MQPRVKPLVNEVGEEIHQHHHQRQDHHNGLHNREIAVGNRGKKQATNAGNGKDLLNDDRACHNVRRRHGEVIGQTTAEDIKIKIGSVDHRLEEATYVVRGRDAKSGMPRELTLDSTELFEALRRPARMIADEVVSVLEDTSPELVNDIAQNGITLTGGGSQLWGMAKMIEGRTGIQCSLADDPDACTAYGCGKSLAWINHMHEGPINIAKKRIMRG